MEMRNSLPDHVTDKNYLELADILANELGRPVSLQEARRTGKDLIALYKALAGKRKIVASTPEEVKKYERWLRKQAKQRQRLQ